MSKLKDFTCPSCPAVFLLSCSLPSSCLYKKNNMKIFYNNMTANEDPKHVCNHHEINC